MIKANHMIKFDSKQSYDCHEYQLGESKLVPEDEPTGHPRGHFHLR